MIFSKDVHLSSINMDASPTRFEIDDTVVLNACDDGVPTLYGRVERTYHALDSHDAVGDCLIIAYRKIPEDIYHQFTASGRPPKGYLFVEFAYEECGHALLPEENVTLISRALAIGDTVKQDADRAMFGTVVDVESRYNLSPICRRVDASRGGPALKFADWLSEDVSSQIENVTVDDLRKAEDFEEGDHVVSHDWAGVVEIAEIDVAVLLDNQTVVWIERPKPWELEIIVRNPHNKPLVAWPDGEEFRRPDILNAHQNGVSSMSPKRLGRGDAVMVTSKRKLKEGRWLIGEYDPNCIPRAMVLDVRTYQLDISWLVPNAFVSPANEEMPSNRLRPYENLHSFREPRDLRRTKDLTRYDHNRKPFAKDAATPDGATSIFTGDGYYPGDSVRFRNPERHPNVSQISPGETYGFDMNEFKVVFSFHHATVLWQDGTATTVDSTTVTPYLLPESDLFPGDLVLAKEGLKMTRMDAAGTHITSDFNEMNFFETDHTLVPIKVGIIQSIEAQERLARVRWYKDPKLELGAYGQVLQRAHFGGIGEDFEDVSLYEVMTEPALIRKRGDMVVIPPLTSPKPMDVQHVSAIPADILAAHPPGPTTLSYLRQMTAHVLPALWEIARPFADIVANIPHQSPPVYDWIGEIIDIGLDGSLAVRLGSLKDCKDVVISQEDLLLIMDENGEYPGPIDDNMDIDSSDVEYSESGHSSNHPPSAIDESIEYDGERLEDQSEDEWSTDDETPESNEARDIDMDWRTDLDGIGNDREYTPTHTNREMVKTSRADDAGVSSDAQIGLRVNSDSIQPAVVTDSQGVRSDDSDSSSSKLTPYLTQESAPNAFEVLEQPPPPDQYSWSESPANNTTFLKRIAKEHRILSSSLPEGEIYVRTYESRLDLLRCLIIGPADTPYEYCPFVVDLHLGPSFPNEPPKAHFHSWTSGLGRVNPNLYEEGKICLSLLGTWPGKSEKEGWSEKATILQVLVSLQGLVFVSKPFYNEAGFETYGDEKVYSLESQQYSEKAYVMARGFAKYALLNASSGLEDILAWLYLCSKGEGLDKGSPPGLLTKVIGRAKLLMEVSSRLKETARTDRTGKVEPFISSPGFLVDGVGHSSDETKTFLKPLSKGALVMLKKTVAALENIQQQYAGAIIEETDL